VKKIIITGALGHIGSALIRKLPLAFPNTEFVLVDNMLTQRYCSLFNLPSFAQYRFHEADIQTVDLSTLIAGAEGVIHLAAVTNAEASFNQLELIEKVNYEGTEKVANACKDTGAALIYISTTSVYGSQATRVDEDCTELKPQSPYADSKLRGEQYLQSLKGLKYIICRFGTIFGVSSGIRFHTAVNKFCWQAVLGKPITVWQTAYQQKRPYLYLEDSLAAIELILKEKLFDNTVYNVVTTNLTVAELVNTLKKYIRDVSIEFVNTKIMNQLSYEVSCQRFQNKGFNPMGHLDHAILETIKLIGKSQCSDRFFI
jgi:UDP-glucose 4-epimerase